MIQDKGTVPIFKMKSVPRANNRCKYVCPSKWQLDLLADLEKPVYLLIKWFIVFRGESVDLF